MNSLLRIGIISWVVLVIAYSFKLWARWSHGDPVVAAWWMLAIMPPLEAAFVAIMARWFNFAGLLMLTVFVVGVVMQTLDQDLGWVKQWADQIGYGAEHWLGALLSVAVGLIALLLCALLWRHFLSGPTASRKISD